MSVKEITKVRKTQELEFFCKILFFAKGKKTGESAPAAATLGEVIRRHRQSCRMTQEFVAEAMGVSRQAVSKWENGTADPSTSNLLKLADLYGVAPEELIRSIRAE